MKKVFILLLGVVMSVASVFAVACTTSDGGGTVGKIEFLSNVEDFSVYATQEVDIPGIEYTEGADLAVTVTDPSGVAIPVSENRFTPQTTGKYYIVYTITLNNLSEEKTVKVTAVSNDVLPELTVEKNENRVLIGTTVTLAAATAKDALGKDLEVKIEVKDPENNEVVIEDGKFIPQLKGVYKVTYTATDVMNKSVVESCEITVYKNPESKGNVPENVKNSFETEKECYIEKLNAENNNCVFSRNDTEMLYDGVISGIYSLKADVSGEGTVNFVSQAIAGSENMSEISKVTFNVYNSGDTALGMSVFNIVFKDGTAVKAEDYKSVPAKSWIKFVANLEGTGLEKEKFSNVYAVQFWFAGAATLYFDDIVCEDRVDVPPAVIDVPAEVKNSFETEEECCLKNFTSNNPGCEITRNFFGDFYQGVHSGSYSLKVKINSGSNFNFVSQAITSDKDLSKIKTLSFWVYNAGDEAFGMSIYKVICTDNTSATPNVYKEVAAKSWYQFSVNIAECGLEETSLTNVWAIQFWVSGAGELYFDDVIYDEKV